MTTEVLCSTGCFSRESDPHSLSVATTGMHALAGTAFEVIFYRGWYDDLPAATDALIAVGARVPVLHAEKSLGPSVPGVDAAGVAALTDRFEANCRLARELGAELLVLHLWGLPDAERRLDEQLAVLPRWVELAAAHGLELSIETLLCAVSTPLATVARCHDADPRSGVTLDLGFLAMADELAAVVDDAVVDAVDHVHVKDLADPSAGWGVPYLLPGDGVLDLDGVLGGLARRGYRGRFTLESQAVLGDGSPDLAGIDRSLDRIGRAVTEAVR